MSNFKKYLPVNLKYYVLSTTQILFEDEYFSKMPEAKVMYALLKDRF